MKRCIGLLMAAALVPACDVRGARDDSLRAAQAREDSIRATRPGQWTEAEVLAYVRALARTVAADSALLQQRSRSRALRAFGRSTATRLRDFARTAESVGRADAMPQPPPVARTVLEAHAQAVERMRAGRDFDLPYARAVHALLRDASSAIGLASAPRRSDEVERLLSDMASWLREALRDAAEIERNLARARSTAPTSPTRAR